MSTARSPLISVVVPAHNEAPGIVHATEVIGGVLDGCDVSWEIIVVDDGSRDGTFERVRELGSREPRIRGVRFSRNFGKESALLAGLNFAAGDAVITIDADLQHPPSLIPQMIEHWRGGARVVDAVKRSRDTDGLLTRFRARLFNALVSKLGGVQLENSSDFKLLDRMVVVKPEMANPRTQPISASAPTTKPKASVRKPSTVTMRSGALVNETSAVSASSINFHSDHLPWPVSRSATSNGRLTRW